MSPEFQYLFQLIQFRLQGYLPDAEPVAEPVMPGLDQWQLPLRDFVYKNKLSIGEATVVLAALAPHVQPELFDTAIASRLKESGDFPKLGGARGKNTRVFLPTGETVLFLLADEDWNTRLIVQQIFASDHLFSQKKILWLEELPGGEPVMSGRLIMSQDYIDTFTLGRPTPPHFSMNFPAKKITESRGWEALVINGELEAQIEEIRTWLNYNDQLLDTWGMSNRIKKGFRVLFYGPPGTGKTLTAGILANEIGKDLYKIDLSMVVSKYIGETEKNLELLFARAEDKGWILFFDEADALFGKRTNVRDAHDKYANQEVSYLLQRIEDFNGLIILATNMKSNIDDAFMRRFNAILRFPFPDAKERVRIWQKSFPTGAVFVQANGNANSSLKNDLIDIPEIVKKHELAGGSIINVVHYASIRAIERRNGASFTNEKTITPGNGNGQLEIYLEDVLQGIKREMNKEGKPFLG